MKQSAYGTVLRALLLFLGIMTLAPGRLPAQDFPLFRGNPARNGYLQKGPQPPLELRWKFQTRHSRMQIESYPGVDDGLSSAIVVGSRVFVGGHDGSLYALKADTGEKLWEYATAGRVVSTPAWSRGLIYFGSSDNFIYALRAEDGKLVWKAPSGSRLFRHVQYRGVRSSPVADGETVYIGGCDGRIRALAAGSGRLRWEMDTGTEGAYASPVLNGKILYVASDGLDRSHLFALEAATGKVRWSLPVPKQVFATPALAEGILYFHVRDEGIYAVRSEDGSSVWRTPISSPQNEFMVFTDLKKSSPAVGPELVYVGVAKQLLALSRANGQIRWQADTQGSVDSSPLVVGSTVYVGSDDRNLYAFDAQTGVLLWKYATGGKVSISPAAGRDLLLIGANDGALYAFAPVKPSPALSMAD